jgi:hypothetical protein
VPSVDPSSTTTISSGGLVWDKIEESAPAKYASPLYTVSTADIEGELIPERAAEPSDRRVLTATLC